MKKIYKCTAALNSLVVQNAQGLVDKRTAYLTGFRIISEYQGNGYFSKLFKFKIENLKNRGYEKVNKIIVHKENIFEKWINKIKSFFKLYKD